MTGLYTMCPCELSCIPVSKDMHMHTTKARFMLTCTSAHSHTQASMSRPYIQAFTHSTICRTTGKGNSGQKQALGLCHLPRSAQLSKLVAGQNPGRWRQGGNDEGWDVTNIFSHDIILVDAIQSIGRYSSFKV